MIPRLLIILFMCSTIYAQDRPPVLIAEGGNGDRIPMLLTKMDTKVKIVGRLAETSLTMTFFNKNEDVLSGTLYFPLPEEATVSGYALDIKGQMVDGVVVEKAIGRKVFEKIVRQGVDPGLIEWTRGNTFKTRVFPIPAKGSRTIKVVYVSELNAVDKTFTLPMNIKEPLKNFKLNISILDKGINPAIKGKNPHNLAFKENDSIWEIEKEFTNQAFTEDITVEIPELLSRKTFVERASDGHYYFVIYDTPQMRKPLNNNIGSISILWDCSLSRKGKHEKEIQLLKAYLQSIPKSTKVTLAKFSNSAERLGEFSAADFDKIISIIANLKYDGGTSFQSLRSLKLKGIFNSDAIMLFSDGLNNWSSKELPYKNPIYTFSADKSTDTPILKFLSLNSGGQWFNLKTQSISQVVNSIGKMNFQYQGTEGGIAVYPKIPQMVNRTMIVTGRIDNNRNKVNISYGYTGDPRDSREYQLKTHDAFESDLIRRYWAQKKLSNLLLDQKDKKDEITQHGKTHKLVTPYTSLIVLESAQQYVEHQIKPPASMQEWVKTYEKEIAKLAKVEKDKTKGQIERVQKMWKTRLAHYNKKFTYPENFRYKPPRKAKKGQIQSQVDGLVDSSAPVPQDAPATVDRAVSEEGLDLVGDAGPDLEDGNVRAFSFNASNSQNSIVYNSLGRVRAEAYTAGGGQESAQPVGGTIQIKKWDPKAVYIDAMRKAENAYDEYLKQRENHVKSPAFYFDCASYFYSVDDHKNGEKVLSNIVELELESAALLRVIAYSLLEAKNYTQAIKILKDVIEIREEEPQSYRDLALAYVAQAEGYPFATENDKKVIYEEALKLLEKVISTKWDRFEEIELIALNEYNRICAKAGLSAKHFNQALMSSLNDDIRIVMSWDADMTDIDLWVTEPSGEKVYFSHNRSTIGGRVSRDFTNGYGPEEYTVRNAMKGKYKIQANFYGSQLMEATGGVTVKVDVYTRYGTAQEKHQTFSIKLKSKKEVIDLGEIEF